MKRFITFDLALNLYRQSRNLVWTSIEKDQFERAILSVLLNLREGSSRPTAKDRRRFYSIALGSFRETQLLLELRGYTELVKQADILGAHLYRLRLRT